MFKAALLHAEHARCAQWVIERVSLSFVGGQSGQKAFRRLYSKCRGARARRGINVVRPL